MVKREYSNLRLLSTSPKGHHFGAFRDAGEYAKKGYDFFLSIVEGGKDWCECMGFVHGKLCYHLKESHKRFGERGE